MSYAAFKAQCAQMSSTRPRIAVRAIILHENKLLLVNAWKGRTHLWCAPGGGVELHQSLTDNLVREVREETGLSIEVGAPCLVNEFHDPKGAFHQVDVYFWATLQGEPTISEDWSDPEGIVTEWRWVSYADRETMLVKPDSLFDVAFGTSDRAIAYDPLEPIVR